MLEQKIEELIAVIKEHTLALLGSKPATTVNKTTPEKTTTNKGKDKPAPASKHTRDDVMALAQQVAGEKTGGVAKGIIADVGGAAKLAEVPDSKLDALFDALTKALAPDAAGEEEEEEL
ncbi:MAG: hypothetical protein ABW006_01705 [Hyphomicrobium sp.]